MDATDTRPLDARVRIMEFTVGNTFKYRITFQNDMIMVFPNAGGGWFVRLEDFDALVAGLNEARGLILAAQASREREDHAVETAFTRRQAELEEAARIKAHKETT